MTRFSRIFVLMTALSLGACSHYSDDLSSLDGSMKSSNTFAYAAPSSPQDIAPAAGGPAITGGSINTFLARDYYDLARYENDKAYDYKAAKQYTQKAMKAQKGERIIPSKLSSFDLPAEYVPELTQARADLINALKTQNSPENGAALAKAQTSFDCWIERAEEADDADHFAECKTQFEQSMAMLILPAAGDAGASTVYDVGFLQTSAIPDEASQKRIEYIAQYLQAPENAPLKVALSGPGDATGIARVSALQKTLAEKGVAADRIVMTVPTASTASAVQATIIGSSQVATTTTTTKFVPVTPTEVPAGTVPAVPAMPSPAPVQ